MRNAFVFSLVLLAGGAFAYGHRPNPEHTDITLASALIRNNQLASFSFCDAGPAGWDSILVLKPYCPPTEIKRFGVDNYWSTRLFTYSQAYDDFNCTLLFLKQNSCVGYCVVSRQLVDLVGLANYKDFNLALITRAGCEKKLHRHAPSGAVSMAD